MRTRRFLIQAPDGTSLWVQLYVQPFGSHWAAMIVPDGTSPPEPGQLQGAVLFAETAEAVERRAVAFLGKSLAQN